MAERLLHVYNHVPTMQPKKYVHDMITKQSVSIHVPYNYSATSHRLSNIFLGNGDDSIIDDRYQYTHRLSNTVLGNGVDSITAGRLSSNTSDNNYNEQILDKDVDRN
eukprot:298053_1